MTSAKNGGPADTTKADGSRNTQPTPTEPDPADAGPDASDAEVGDRVFYTQGYVAEFTMEEPKYKITTEGTVVNADDVAEVRKIAKANGVELRESKVK